MPFSVSRIETYRGCPLAYRLLYLDTEGGPSAFRISTPEQERGTAVHVGAEAMVVALAKGASIDEARVAARTAVNDIKGTVSQEAWSQIGFFLDRLLDQPFPEKRQGDVWQAEAAFKFDRDWNPVPEGEKDSYFRGFIDFLIFNPADGFIRVTDWKTSRKTESPDALSSNLQLRAYALAAYTAAVAKGFTIRRIEMVRHYTTVAIAQKYVPSIEEVKGWRDYVEAEILAIEKATEFDARPDEDRCFGCAARGVCPARDQAGIEKIEVKEAADVVRAWREVTLLRSKADDLEKTVKAWVKNRGPVKVGDKTLDFWPLEKRQVLDDAVDVLRDAGLTDAAILSIAGLTVSGLDRGLKGRPELVEACVTRKVESRFGTKGE